MIEMGGMIDAVGLGWAWAAPACLPAKCGQARVAEWFSC
jgi:hypothetical protein